MSWKIYALRTFLVLYVIGDTILITLAIGGTAVGDSEMAVTLMDMEGDVPIDVKAPLWGVVIAGLVGAAYIAIIVWLFRSLNALVTAAHLGHLASSGIARCMRSLGRSLIALWVVLILIETIVPLVLFVPVVDDVAVELAPFDLTVVLALIGMALWLTAGLAEDAEKMKEELASVV